MTSILGICFFLLISRGVAVSLEEACTNAYQEYPSEYVYHKQSVTRAESIHANCLLYPLSFAIASVHPENYIHCNGTQLRLADSEIGPDQYSGSYCYVWDFNRRELLFIFSTKVNLSIITLHYYSNNILGLPGLRFFAVPDDFNIWDAPSSSYSYEKVAAVPTDEEPAGRRKVSVMFSTYTKRVLLQKLQSRLSFAVSEFEFISASNCTETSNIQPESDVTNSIPPTTLTQDISGTSRLLTYFNRPATAYSNTTAKVNLATTKTYTSANNQSINTMLLATGFIVATVIVLTTVIIVVIALLFYFRNSAQRKVDYDNSCPTFFRGPTQQLQSQSHHNTDGLYDQIHLSPLTGQAEVISKPETENTNSGSQNQCTRDTEQNTTGILQSASLSTKPLEENIDGQPAYGIANKKQKRGKIKIGKEIVEAGKENELVQSKKLAIGNIEELYTAVQKKPKCRAAYETSSTPPHTVEQLYTAVVKKYKCNAAEDTPQVPPHTIEELYTAVEKKSNDKAIEDEEEAPPIPPHTVEELYTLVMKNPQCNVAEDTPPILPHTVEEMYTGVEKKSEVANTTIQS